MANPQNPLDRFKTYTYHFELHGAHDWHDIEAVIEKDHNLRTDPEKPNGTLLINTRRDAHQSIDNVRFTYEPSSAAVVSEITFDVLEPGGMLFAQKFQALMWRGLSLSVTSSMHFLLKIFFVGEIGSVPLEPIAIPIIFNDMEASFNHQGGKYGMKFVSIASVMTRNGRNKAAVLGLVNNNITIKASTVSDALKELEEKLNENYEIEYEANGGRRKRMRYVIENTAKIDGAITLANTTDRSHGSDSWITFQASKMPVMEMIWKILLSSKTVSDQIAENRSKILADRQIGLKLPVVRARWMIDSTEAKQMYDILLLEGGRDKNYIFDFYFSDAGKNVDVLEFDVKFSSLIAWLNSSEISADKSINFSSTVQTSDQLYWSNQICHPDRTVSRMLGYQQPNDPPILGSGDVFTLPISTAYENSGMIDQRHDSARTTRLALNTLAAAASATTNQFMFKIRGHYKILDDCATPIARMIDPGKAPSGFGNVEQMFVKVNINSRRGYEPPTPVYYTGWYLVTRVENIFSGGQFLQLMTLTLQENDKFLLSNVRGTQPSTGVVRPESPGAISSTNTTTPDGDVFEYATGTHVFNT